MGQKRRRRWDTNSFIVRWAVNAVAIWGAIQLVPGVEPIEQGALPPFLKTLVMTFPPDRSSSACSVSTSHHFPDLLWSATTTSGCV